jgi:pimeloyl-ACP methyl ester carboxylesterase
MQPAKRLIFRYPKTVIFLLLFALLYVGWSQLTKQRGNQKVSFRPAAQTCGVAGKLRYCSYASDAGTNGDIIYYLHGRNLDETLWNDDTYLTAMIQAEWQRAGAKPPMVVAVSYGPVWILTPKGKKPESGLLDDFVKRLPAIEEKTGKPRRRILLGESMGGLNVLIAGLSHPATFAKIAALCPGVYTVSPFSPLSTFRAAAERTGADPKIGFGIWWMSRNYVADEQEWQRISPLSLIKQANAGYPALYISNGIYDAYGNYEGSELLARTAQSRGGKVDWHPLYGGHCATDIASLASFLVSE